MCPRACVAAGRMGQSRARPSTAHAELTRATAGPNRRDSHCIPQPQHGVPPGPPASAGGAQCRGEHVPRRVPRVPRAERPHHAAGVRYARHCRRSAAARPESVPAGGAGPGALRVRPPLAVPRNAGERRRRGDRAQLLRVHEAPCRPGGHGGVHVRGGRRPVAAAPSAGRAALSAGAGGAPPAASGRRLGRVLHRAGGGRDGGGHVERGRHRDGVSELPRAPTAAPCPARGRPGERGRRLDGRAGGHGRPLCRHGRGRAGRRRQLVGA